jgi:hypothetical protein
MDELEARVRCLEIAERLVSDYEARAIERQSHDLQASYKHDSAAYLTPEAQQAPGWGA